MRKISSFALAFAFLMPLAGCPGDDTGETDTVADTANVPTTDAPTTDAPTTDAPTTDAPTTDAPTTDAPTTGVDSTTTGGGGGGGFCGLTCEAPADCAMGGNEADWACTDGFCEYIAEFPPCDPATCDDIMIGVCGTVDGNSVCTTPCDDDSMCAAGFTECTGTDDDGNMICAAIPCGGVAEGEACEIAGFGQIGVCTAGVCSCTDDTECTAPDYACNG
jgi:hypothetical protein